MNTMYAAMDKAGLVKEKDKARLKRAETVAKEYQRKKAEKRHKLAMEKARLNRLRKEKVDLLRNIKRLLGDKWEQLKHSYREQPLEFLQKQYEVLSKSQTKLSA